MIGRDVRSRVVISENFQDILLDTPDGHVCQQWEQITWSATRIFADQA